MAARGWADVHTLGGGRRTTPSHTRPPRPLPSLQLWMGVVPVAVMALFPTLGALGARFGAHPAWQRYGAPARGLLEQNKVCCGALWDLLALALAARGAALLVNASTDLPPPPPAPPGTVWRSRRCCSSAPPTKFSWALA